MFKIVYKLFTLTLFIFAINLGCGGSIKGEGNHTFYFYSKSSNATIKTISESKSKYFLYFKNNLKGESVEFFNEHSALDFINQLKANYVFSEIGEDFYCEYYYSNKIKDYVIINGHKVNLHLSYGNEVFTVGTPIIFGSF